MTDDVSPRAGEGTVNWVHRGKGPRRAVFPDDAGGLITAAAVAAALAELGGPLVRTVTLTAGDLAVLDTVPFELVPAPGVGRALCFIHLASSFLRNGGLGAVGGSSIYFAGDAATQLGALGPAISDSVDYRQGNIAPSSYNSLDFNAANTAIVLQSPGAPIVVTGAIGDAAFSFYPGTGYAPGDTFTVDDSIGVTAEGVVDTVDGGGGILTFHLTNRGTGYTVTELAITATSGVGVDAAIDINTLDYSVNPMTLQMQTVYTVMDVS